MATLLEMRRSVSRRLDQPLVGNDIPASGVFWTQAEVNEWINNGRRQVYAEIAELEGPTLTAEATGTYTASARSVAINGVNGTAGGIFNLEVDPLKLMGVFDITSSATAIGTKIDLIPYNELVTVQSGTPTSTSVSSGNVGAWWGSNPMNLSLAPIPQNAKTLRLRYIPGTPADLTDVGAATNTPYEIPSTHHDLLVLFAVVQAKKKEEDSSWQDDWTTYTELLNRLKANIEERNSANSRHVVVTDGSDYTSGMSRYY